MKTIDLAELELLEVWSKADPTERVSFTFAINPEAGATGSSVAARGKLVQIAGGSRNRVVNTGGDAARMLFFFDEAADIVTFDEPLMPLDLAVIG